MSVPQIFALSCIEIVGDFALKNYANNGGITNLGIGLIGYVGVVFMLIVSLQGSSILMVNGAWDAMSTLIECTAAYLILGERFENNTQYLGLFLIVIGLMMLKVPWKKNRPFYFPSLKNNPS
jgi:multidrug transporter EmrE-like cation transporter